MGGTQPHTTASGAFKWRQGLPGIRTSATLPDGITDRVFRLGVQVGTVPFPKKLWEAKIAAGDGLVNHNADLARILDMENNGSIIGVVRR